MAFSSAVTGVLMIGWGPAVVVLLAFVDLVGVGDRPVVQTTERLPQDSPSGVREYSTPTGEVGSTRRRADRRTEGYRREHDAWAGQIARPASERLIRAGLAHDAQTRDGERDLEGLLRKPAG